MSLIVLTHTAAPGQVVPSVGINANFTGIRDAFNNTGVQTDIAKTITVAHTFNADILFGDALYDIGKVGATRPRDGFFSRTLTAASLVLSGSITGATTIAASGNVTSGDMVKGRYFTSSGLFTNSLATAGTWDFYTTDYGYGYLVSVASATNGQDFGLIAFVYTETNQTIRIHTLYAAAGIALSTPAARTLRITNTTGATQALTASVMQVIS